MVEESSVLDALKSRGNLRKYQVRSQYLDTPDGTWSKLGGLRGASIKTRLRSYNDEPTLWLETKEHRPGGWVIKHRRRVDYAPTKLAVVGLVSYERTAFEDARLRVTIDTDVRAYSALIGYQYLSEIVIEVKSSSSSNRVPTWLANLLPPVAQNWSKSKWMLGLA